MPNMTEEEVDLAERLAMSAGLIKVWNGRDWQDLRYLMKDLCAYIRTLHAQLDALNERTDLLLAEHERTLVRLDEAHAEVATLGSLLREGT